MASSCKDIVVDITFSVKRSLELDHQKTYTDIANVWTTLERDSFHLNVFDWRLNLESDNHFSTVSLSKQSIKYCCQDDHITFLSLYYQPIKAHLELTILLKLLLNALPALATVASCLYLYFDRHRSIHVLTVLRRQYILQLKLPNIFHFAHFFTLDVKMCLKSA